MTLIFDDNLYSIVCKLDSGEKNTFLNKRFRDKKLLIDQWDLHDAAKEHPGGKFYLVTHVFGSEKRIYPIPGGSSLPMTQESISADGFEDLFFSTPQKEKPKNEP